jgi:hypothetical protein
MVTLVRFMPALHALYPCNTPESAWLISFCYRYSTVQCGSSVSESRGSEDQSGVDEDAVVKRHPSKEEDQGGFPEEHP